MAHRWAFRIADSNVLESLSWSLHGPDISILRDEVDSQPPQFLWASAHLDVLQPGPTLFGRAAALKEVFDGTMFLLEPGYRPDRLEDLVDWQQDRIVSVFQPAPLLHPFESQVLQQPLAPTYAVRVRTHLLEGAMYKARSDGDVLSILQILGRHGIAFGSLYQVRDCLNYAGIDDKQIAFLAGSSKKEVDRFRHTANNYGVLGPSGRHGKTNTQPPPSPMTVDEAAAIILPAAKKFILHRISGTMPPSPRPAAPAVLAPKASPAASRHQTLAQTAPVQPSGGFGRQDFIARLIDWVKRRWTRRPRP